MTNSVELVVFDAKEIATLGNKFLGSIVAHELAKESAEKELAEATKRESFIDMELTKCALYLHGEETIDLYKIYGNNQDSASLYRSILVALGVLKQTVKNDKVLYNFTDPALADQFEFPQEMNDPKREGETDEQHKARTAEFLRRRSRRNALNIRLNRCVKAAIALFEAKATVADLIYRPNAVTGETEAVITKGPVEVMGKMDSAVIHSKNAAKIEGATETPTIAGLAKVADAKHKEKPASKGETETTTRKEGENGNTEADFLAIMNAAMMAIKGKEGEFTDAEKVVLRNLNKEIVAAVK